MKKFSIRPFGFKGKIFERLRHAEKFASESNGKLIKWGNKFKVYYENKTPQTNSSLD